MKFISLIPILFLFTACSMFSSRHDAAENVEEQMDQQVAKAENEVATAVGTSKGIVWSHQGVLGPDNWGDLSPDFQACKAGRQQSPIHLIWSRPVTGSKLPSFNYKMSNLSLLDNGHAIQINVASGNTAMLGGQKYELKSIHFRTSSEHSLSGNILPMEVQYLHRNEQGQTAMVSFFAIEGQEHKMISALLPFLPNKKGQSVELNKLFDPISLLPKKFHHYSYKGSLTTPPCTENVKWFVLNTPVSFSRDQILQFRQVYSVNNRPIQPLNGRKVTNH